VLIDIYSRYVPGWMLAHAENAHLAKALLADTATKQAITSGQLTIHADRGSPMTAKPVAFLLANLGSPSRTPGRTAPTTTPTARASSAP
jgi:putative transposase